MKHYPAATAAIAAVVLIAGRLLAVARFDVNTASVILSVSGSGNIAAGTALTLLPFALVVATCALALRTFVDDRLISLPIPAGLALALAAALMVAISALTLVLFSVFFIVFCIGLGRALRWRGESADIRGAVAGSRILRSLAVMVLSLAVVLPIILQRPWFPSERITVKHGSPSAGYFLGESVDDFVLMDVDTHSVKLIPKSEVTSRQVCSGSYAAGGVAKSVPRVTLRGPLLSSLLWGQLNNPSYRSCS